MLNLGQAIRVRLTVERLEDRTVPNAALVQALSESADNLNADSLAISSNATANTRFALPDGSNAVAFANGQQVNTFNDIFEGFSGLVRVAVGDVNGDGIADTLVGVGPGGGPRVAVFDGASGQRIFDFFVFEDTFRGGVNVATADMDGDGVADIIVSAQLGGSNRVRVFSGLSGREIGNFFATPDGQDDGLREGSSAVSVGGLLVVSTVDQLGRPVVRLFNLDGTPADEDVYPFGLQPRLLGTGPLVAGDFNGDGQIAELILGSSAVGIGQNVSNTPTLIGLRLVNNELTILGTVEPQNTSTSLGINTLVAVPISVAASDAPPGLTFFNAGLFDSSFVQGGVYVG